MHKNQVHLHFKDDLSTIILPLFSPVAGSLDRLKEVNGNTAEAMATFSGAEDSMYPDREEEDEASFNLQARDLFDLK